MKKLAFAVGELIESSGIIKVVKNISIELSKNDYCVVIIATGIFDGVMAKTFEQNGIKIINLDIEKYGAKKRYYHYVNAIYSNLKNENIDILVVSGMEHVLFYGLAILKLKSNVTKLYAWEHRNFNSKPKFKLEWWGRRYALKYWSGVICLTKKDAKQYMKYTKNKDKIFQIYNLTNFKVTRTSYNIKSKKIVSCGHLEYIKGFDMLIDVARKVFDRHPSWTWDIYGEGKERDNLKKIIAINHLENNIFLRGYVSNMNELYQKYSFFVLTSRSEGMGMVLVEAQKAGLPVISFDIKCGPSDVIEDGKNGYLIKPFDINEMYLKICGLIEDEECRQKFSDCSEINLDEFDKEYIVSKWLKLLL